jgi:hypothetical protein
VVWRYDPVILSSATPVSWHLEQAERLANHLSESTRRLVFSFYDYYGKGQGRLHAALQGTCITLKDIIAPEQAMEQDILVRGLKEVTARHGLKILSCSEEIDLSTIGIEHGACIDGTLIRELFGGTPSPIKDKNQRTACRCVESVDMGIYNTCHFRCSYCYANFNEGVIESNSQKHDVDSPSLLGRHDGHIEIQSSLSNKKKSSGSQQNLF